jgi:DNA (cytosine-5)-methyltransferase 1
MKEKIRIAAGQGFWGDMPDAPACRADEGTKLRVLDIFAGAGGFSLGFQAAGYSIVGGVEVDQWACETFAFNHPQAVVVKADITQLTDTEIIEKFAGCFPDVVLGGPPCQGFSVANRQAGDPKDPRNSLFTEFLRVGRLLEPKLLALENVPHLALAKTGDGQSVLEIIKRSLEDLGYFTYSAVLSATSFGVPQIRNRLFIVAARQPLENPFPLPTHYWRNGAAPSLFDEDLRPCPTLWDAISDMPELDAGAGGEEMAYQTAPRNGYQAALREGAAILFNHKAMNHTKRMVERFAAMKWGDSGNDVPEHLKPRRRNSQELATNAYDQNNRRMHPFRPCHTIAASFYANFVHPYQNRNFTAREGARIQSFPDWYRFCGKPTVVSHKLLAREERHDERYLCQYNQIGNAVPPLMAQVIAANLRPQLEAEHNVSSRKQLVAERSASV